VDVDRLRGTAVGLAPHRGQQLALEDDLPATGGEVQEEVELLPAQVHRLAVDQGDADAGVKLAAKYGLTT
jgi:hypothetical protein